MIYAERVRLRRIEREDLPRFVEWLNDPEVREGLALLYPLSLVQEEDWFASTLKLDPAAQPFSIDARAATPGTETASAPEWTHIGSLGFHGVDWRNRWAELGICIGNKSFWGAGYGGDALRALLGWGFRELNLNRICLKVFEHNTRALRCYEKLGFRHEGRLRQDRFHTGRYWDTLIMGLLRDEFRP